MLVDDRGWSKTSNITIYISSNYQVFFEGKLMRTTAIDNADLQYFV